MSVELEEKKKQVIKAQKDCEELLVVIVQERRQADEQTKVVMIEKEKIGKEEEVTRKHAAEAQADLDKATPALDEAKRALEGLNKKDIGEIKQYASPPAHVQMVLSAVMILRKDTPDWDTAKKHMNDPAFLQQLIDYEKDALTDGMLGKLHKWTKNPKFNPVEVGKVSLAAKSLCEWVRAMEAYGHINKVVAPKKLKVKIAMEELERKQNLLRM